jgi:hypothetical protein
MFPASWGRAEPGDVKIAQRATTSGPWIGSGVAKADVAVEEVKEVKEVEVEEV